ncbi:DUF885 domain-containing protein [Sphingomonas nostoxanthinifaciens]|uniref:DUF885 domain-containing protein n=1 Tax=Sphingomonas nostoxanthinifaciens TaxID=2872652 RepID=UPI001CC21BDE|nr:DUF885 domain-containing protein [Sphingomonas nostoxanthinifaciens]
MEQGTGVTRRQAVALAGAALVARPAFAAVNDDAGRLHALLDRASKAEEARAPLSATRRAPAFVDPLADDYARALGAERAADAAALKGIDRTRLDVGDRIAFDVFGYQTKRSQEFVSSGAFDVARRAPLDPSFGLQVEFPDFVAATAPFKTNADYEAGLQRLDGFAGYLDETIVRLREGLARGQVQNRVVVKAVLAEVDAVLAQPVEQSPFYAAVTKLPTDMPAAERARLTAAYRAAITGKVLPGYARWRSFLNDTYAPRATEAPGRWAMKDGALLYAAELQRHTTTTTPADAIHQLGLSEVARILGEMERAKAATGFAGDLHAFFDYIRTDPRFYCKTPEELLGRFKAIEAKIWLSIPKLFAHRPKAPFSVQPLPTLGGQRGTGYYRPGPPDGVTPGVLYFNMAMLGTRPIPTLETLTLHEGIPGHHFQINLVRENMKLPDYLRLRQGENFTAYTEGWGLYSESLGRELGMFGDPYQWFGHLDMEMLRAVRLVVDTGIHAQRWDRQRAIDYMLANTSMAPHDVAVEIDRYIAAPGQACAYKMGELKLRALRERATTALGGRFDIRDYHDQVLGTGALPLQVLEAKIDGWIKAGGGPAYSGF